MTQEPWRTCRVSRSAYVHIPFCVSKCHYCEFNSYPGMESLFGEYARAVVMEIEDAAQASDAHAHVGLDTVYFGGGTPTVLSSDHLVGILTALDDCLGISDGAEITVEANPGTVDEAKLVQLCEHKFNRMSLGVQSFDDEFLQSIGRAHTSGEAVEAYHLARRAGFQNVSIDLMFALPGQTPDHWRNTLDAAIQLGPEHVSLYELTIEEGTRFAELYARGELDLPDEDSQIAMYELAISMLTSVGFEHYEVSNFARPGARCMHNQVYWRNEPYFGFGAGATAYVCGDRSRRVGDPRRYVAAVCSEMSPVEFSEHLTGREALGETVIQGLRMLDGVDVSKINDEYCTDVALEFGPQISSLVERGLLEGTGGRIRVTHRGLLLLNDVSREFLS